MFHGALNDFLPAGRRGQGFAYRAEPHSTIKDTIEALGVPHPEIGRVIVNGEPADPGSRLREGDRIDVFPATALSGEARFIIDTHLGRLARLLRMLGFDALYRNDYGDDELARVSSREDRILLTRDVGLLKRAIVVRGYWLRSVSPTVQLGEVLRRFDLAAAITPFGRCIRCNGTLEPVARELVEDVLPPRTRREFDEFRRCQACGRVYWKGSHYERMDRLVRTIRGQE